MDESDPKRDAFAIVVEWMDENGERWLSKAHSASIADWMAKGMHYEAIHGFASEDSD